LYEGTVWYQKSFDYQAPANTRVFLYFGAANYHARVWLNEKPLCEHEGGFTPFNCEATTALQDGQNVVIVSVNDARHADDIPSLRPDWYNYGGLTRDIRLVEVPRQFIEQYSIQLDHENARRIAGWIRLAVGLASKKLSVKMPELKLSTVATTNNEGCTLLG